MQSKSISPLASPSYFTEAMLRSEPFTGRIQHGIGHRVVVIGFIRHSSEHRLFQSLAHTGGKLGTLAGTDVLYFDGTNSSSIVVLLVNVRGAAGPATPCCLGTRPIHIPENG